MLHNTDRIAYTTAFVIPSRWVVESILHGVDPLSYFSVQPVHHDWCTKGRGMYYPVCGIMHIKITLAANRKE